MSCLSTVHNFEGYIISSLCALGCLPSVKKQKHCFTFFFIQCIIKELSHSVYVIRSRMIKVSVRVISQSLFFFHSMYNKRIIRLSLCDQIQNDQGLGEGYQPKPFFFFFIQCIIKELSDSVYVIRSRMSVRVISQSLWIPVITLPRS